MLQTTPLLTPTLTYASGTWTLPKIHERMIKSAQRKMIRLIVQTKRKYKMKTSKKANADERPEKDEKDAKENESNCIFDEETGEGSKESSDMWTRQWRLLSRGQRWGNWQRRNGRRRLDWIYQEKHERSWRIYDKNEDPMLDWNSSKNEMEDHDESCILTRR